MASIDDFSDLSDLGFQGGAKETITPEDEFFHSIYTATATRKNHINVEEKSGMLQIRGVQYNCNEIYMVITHVKDILVKVKQEKRKESLECFSYKEGAPPWYGTTRMPNGNQRPCPQTSAERAINDYCRGCKAQLIVAGVLTKSDGTPILTENNKPIFVFMRGKGMKYANISNYLNERFKEDLPPVFTPVTEQTKRFEKQFVNNKRFVTKITNKNETSSYGSSTYVFVLEKGTMIPNEAVISVMKLAKQTITKFNEKFDWSKGKQAVGYNQTQSAAPGVMTFDSPSVKDDDTNTTQQESTPSETPKQSTFSFDDITW